MRFETIDRYEVLLKREGYLDGHATILCEPWDKQDYHIDLEKIITVSVSLIEVEPTLTAKGIKLQIVCKPTLAYLEVIERSPNVRSVTRVTNNEDTSVAFPKTFVGRLVGDQPEPDQKRDRSPLAPQLFYPAGTEELANTGSNRQMFQTPPRLDRK